jgi:GTP cyclohydrolase I
MLTVQDIIKKIYNKLTKKRKKEIAKELEAIKAYNVDENYPLTDDQRAVITFEIKNLFEDIFKKLLFKLDDPNFIDTPSRVASMWVNELMVGRFLEKPRLEAFPVEEKHLYTNEIYGQVNSYNGIIVKKIDIRSLCSHHLMPFFTDGDNSYALVAYKPTTHYLGISKIQRLAHWLGARPQLQEQLTKNLFDEMTTTLKNDDVFVLLKNLTHTCETLRGAKTECGSTTSFYYGGVFHDSLLRKEVEDLVK